MSRILWNLAVVFSFAAMICLVQLTFFHLRDPDVKPEWLSAFFTGMIAMAVIPCCMAYAVSSRIKKE